MFFWRIRSATTITITFLLFVVFVCFNIAASAQQSSYPILTNVDTVEAWFDKTVSLNNSAIVNGPEYRIPFNALFTHPFYQSAESDRSFVQYDGDRYKNVDLLYDIYGDILVLKWLSLNGTFLIKLDKKKVQSFDLHHHHFKKFTGGIATKEGTYFDVLFEEKQFAILVQRFKVERIGATQRNYEEDNISYILDQGEWIRINGKNSFFKTLKKDQRKELKDFIKRNHIKLRKRKDEDLTKLGAFCHSLKEGKK